jgi:AcrR family transcriptional regulator
MSLSTSECRKVDDLYDGAVPKLWTETIDAHRAAVREAALDATATLVAERGLAALTMSQIAERADIGRATLYKYFPDVQTVLTAWHERQITTHLERLAVAADPADPAGVRLEAVLRTYALSQHHSAGHHSGELAALLHRGEHIDRAHQRLHGFVSDLIADGAGR